MSATFCCQTTQQSPHPNFPSCPLPPLPCPVTLRRSILLQATGEMGEATGSGCSPQDPSSPSRFQGAFCTLPPPRGPQGGGLLPSMPSSASSGFPTSVHEIQGPQTLARGLLLPQTVRGYNHPGLSKYSASGLVMASRPLWKSHPRRG